MPAPDPRPDHEWDADPEPRRAPEPAGTRRRRFLLAGILAALFAAMLLVKLLTSTGQEETALFYVGVPAVIAITVTLTARPRSAVGIALLTTTIGLALAGPLLDEGVVCLVMAAPLLYGIAAGTGAVVDQARRPRPHRSAVIALPLLIAVVAEGAGGFSYLPRGDAATATVQVAAAPAEFATALAAAPRYGTPDAVLLTAVPFPRPVSATGTGLDTGDRRVVTFDDRRSLGIGSQPTPRSMTLRISESTTSDDGGRVVFDVTSDTTLARWMDLRAAEVEWHRTHDGGTEATWTLHWTRTFDPSWYFGPLQHHFTGLAAGYLATTFADTAGSDA